MELNKLNKEILSRNEAYLANIAGLPHPPLKTPMDRIGLFLGNLAGIIAFENLPNHSLSPVEHWLGYICGRFDTHPDFRGPELELPLNVYLAAIAGMYDGDLPKPRSRFEHLLKIVAKEISGNVVASQCGSLLLVYGANETSLVGLSVFGKNHIYGFTGTGDSLVNIDDIRSISDIFGKGLYGVVYRDKIYAAGIIDDQSTTTSRPHLVFDISRHILTGEWIGRTLRINIKSLYIKSNSIPVNRVDLAVRYSDSETTTYNPSIPITENISRIEIRVIFGEQGYTPGSLNGEEVDCMIQFTILEGTSSKVEDYTGRMAAPNQDYPNTIEHLGVCENLLEGISWHAGFPNSAIEEEFSSRYREDHPRSIFTDPIYIDKGASYDLGVMLKSGISTEGSNAHIRYRLYGKDGLLKYVDIPNIGSNYPNQYIFPDEVTHFRLLLIEPTHVKNFNSIFIRKSGVRFDLEVNGGNLIPPEWLTTIYPDRYDVEVNEDGSIVVSGGGDAITIRYPPIFVKNLLEEGFVEPDTIYVFNNLVNSTSTVNTQINMSFKNGDPPVYNQNIFSISRDMINNAATMNFVIQGWDVPIGYVFDKDHADVVLSKSVRIPQTPYRPRQHMPVFPHFSYGIPAINLSTIDTTYTYTGEITYTDSNGNKWVSDEINFGRGVYIQRIGRFSDLTLKKYISAAAPDRFVISVDHIVNMDDILLWPGTANAYLLTPKLPFNRKAGSHKDKPYVGIRISVPYGQIIAETDKQYTDSHDTLYISEGYYILKEPKVIPLASDEVLAFKRLTMYNPTTMIVNDRDAYMKLEYLTKNISKYRLSSR